MIIAKTEAVSVVERAAAFARVTPGDRVSKSQSHALEAALGSVRANVASDRAGRVREIALAVKRGGYQPDVQKIASALIEDAKLSAQLNAALTPHA